MKLYKKATALMTGLMASALIWAQDEKKVDVDINLNKGSVWYQQPWVWVVGAAIFILLLVALLKSGGSKKE